MLWNSVFWLTDVAPHALRGNQLRLTGSAWINKVGLEHAFILLIWQKKHDKWQNSHNARLQKQLQTALILSVTFIWSHPWVGLKGFWLYFLKIVWNSVLYISLNESAICCIFSARNYVFGYGLNYWIDVIANSIDMNFTIFFQWSLSLDRSEYKGFSRGQFRAKWTLLDLPGEQSSELIELSHWNKLSFVSDCYYWKNSLELRKLSSINRVSLI